MNLVQIINTFKNFQLSLEFVTQKILIHFLIGTARYNDAYPSDSYGSNYDSSPFQTVPSGGNGAVPNEPWNHNHELSLAHHAHTHPAFLSAGMGRDPLTMQDTKPMIQNGMITGYPSNPGAGGPCFTGKFKISRKNYEMRLKLNVLWLCEFTCFRLLLRRLNVIVEQSRTRN